MTQTLDFNGIRPFHDHEVNEAVNLLAAEPGFIKTARYLFPQYPIDVVLSRLRSCNSLKDFHAFFLAPFMKTLIENSIREFTVSGLDKLDKNQSYLFISNHRDIILDSALLNHILLINGHISAESAIGSNLLILPWITNLMKLNKTFIVNRNVPTRQIIESSNLLSSYIRHNLLERNVSVWIAQREGRTKNGSDRTQPSLLKMINMSGTKSFAENYKELKVVPLSISYEYEPCDKAKVSELYQKATDHRFKKTRVDDLMSMGHGLTSPKGNVHYGFGKQIDFELDEIDKISNKNEQYSLLAQEIDKQIYSNFNLNPLNYVALDLMRNTNKMKQYYQKEDKEKFVKFMNLQLSEIEGNKELQQKMFLEIYANPVVNKSSVEKIK